MSRIGQACAAVCAVALIGLVAVPARALTDEEIFRDLRFNFINPGGRSLGMGGAFISLADDATAAQANPAGLTQLLSAQFFLEIRAANPDAIDTEVSFRDPFLPDDGFDVAVRTQPDSVISPSFVSYVYPWSRLAISGSRQELINISNRASNRFEFSAGDDNDIRIGEGAIDVDLVNWNLSLAFKAHDKFRIGLTASYGELSLNSNIVNSYVDPSGTLIGNPGLAGVPIEMYQTRADGSDTDVTFTAGLLWQVHRVVSLGAVYRQGGTFEIEQTLIARPIDPSLVPGTIAQRVFFNQTDTFLTAQNTTATFTNKFRVPDTWGVGVSWRPLGSLTLALDAVTIQYSDLLEDFNSRLNVLTAGFENEQDAGFTIDDQTNLHFGAEYILPSKKPSRRVILRAGYHQDKDNRLRSDFAPGGFGLGSNDVFPGRDDQNHYSLGVGFVVGNNFQLDTAVDLSDVGTEAVVSLIYKF